MSSNFLIEIFSKCFLTVLASFDIPFVKLTMKIRVVTPIKSDLKVLIIIFIFDYNYMKNII